jgi:purine nucleoside phosphorylase
MKTLLIGGTGFSQMDYLDDVKAETIRTPFGGAVIYQGTYKGIPTGFLPRHGMNHESLAPQVNYRANIWAAKELGYSRILGTSAVATLNPNIKVGDLVLLDQLVDFTEGREHTFNLRSANMTEPFCSQMRQVIQESAEELDIPLHPTATYLCFKGPRYETAAEIRLFQNWGMDVIGMTNATEAALCREIRICYATIALVTNAGAGLSDQGPNLTRHRQVTTENLPKFKSLTLHALQKLPTDRNCQCIL